MGIRKKEALFLFLGDIVLFLLALWIMLAVRYQSIPSEMLIIDHLVPFSFLFVAWVAVFFIAGLYDNHTVLLKSKLPTIILQAQMVNVALAALFFFLIPYFVITPKTNLVIYLFVSFGLIMTWRIYIFPFLRTGARQRAILIGKGKELEELEEEINNNSRYDLKFVLIADLNVVTKANLDTFQKEVLEQVNSGNISVIVADSKSEIIEPLLPLFYNLTFLNLNFRFLDLHTLYEDIFERVPLSMLEYEWFLVNVSSAPQSVYDFLKRSMDIIIAAVLLLVPLIAYPFILFAVKLEDNGPVFLTQKRVGQFNAVMSVYKFRSMRTSEDGVWIAESSNQITKVGKFLRKTRLDEFPQLFNVLRGDMSLIGPRPDMSGLGSRLSEEIPYYNVRQIIKPGLSGWAQIKQDTIPQSIEETKTRLAYDLYYVKNRSFMFDIKIALQTIKKLLSVAGA